MRELNSPMTTYECERVDRQDLTEYEKNAANQVANLLVKRPLEDGEGQ